MTVLFDNLSQGPLRSSSWSWTRYFILHAFLHPVITQVIIGMTLCGRREWFACAGTWLGRWSTAARRPGPCSRGTLGLAAAAPRGAATPATCSTWTSPGRSAAPHRRRIWDFLQGGVTLGTRASIVGVWAYWRMKFARLWVRTHA